MLNLVVVTVGQGKILIKPGIIWNQTHDPPYINVVGTLNAELRVICGELGLGCQSHWLENFNP